MTITFLGTGTSQGVPVIACGCEVCSSADSRDKRLRSSILIESDDKIVGIDSGPDFRYQMLRENVQHLDAIVFTHEHKDHIAGMDDIRAFNYKQNAPMDIYADARVQKALVREFPYIFDVDNRYPGIPQVNIHPIGMDAFNIGKIHFTPIEVMHHRLPILGFRIGGFTYITDANHIDSKEKEKIKGSEILVINALRKKEHISHFNLQQAIDLAKELKIPKTFLTHISHQLGLHDDVNKELPTGIQLAWDGLQIEI